MTAPLNTASLVSSWREAMDGVTPGPWYSESVETEGSYGSGEDTSEGFDSYVVRTEAQKHYGEDAVVCDALNSGTAEVHEEFDEDGTHAWDEPGRRNMDWIARCSPSGISALLAALESTSRALSEKEGELAEANKWSERQGAELSELSAAIGPVRFMDPPDGGDVSLAEQVRRMAAALKASEERGRALMDAYKRASEILRGRGCPGWGIAKDILNEAVAKAEGVER